MLSSGVCLENSIQKDKVACWHGDRGRVRVWVCEVGRTTDIRNVGYVLIGRERRRYTPVGNSCYTVEPL